MAVKEVYSPIKPEEVEQAVSLEPSADLSQKIANDEDLYYGNALVQDAARLALLEYQLEQQHHAKAVAEYNERHLQMAISLLSHVDTTHRSRS